MPSTLQYLVTKRYIVLQGVLPAMLYRFDIAAMRRGCSWEG